MCKTRHVMVAGLQPSNYHLLVQYMFTNGTYGTLKLTLISDWPEVLKQDTQTPQKDQWVSSTFPQTEHDSKVRIIAL